jgi:DnaK suppressor protein
LLELFYLRTASNIGFSYNTTIGGFVFLTVVPSQQEVTTLEKKRTKHTLRTGVKSMGKIQRPNKHLKEKQLKQLRDKLLAQKEDILNKISDQSQYELDPNEQKEQVDAANNNREKEQEARLLSRQGFLVKKISKTLADMEGGEYGLCKECDAPIPFERLYARPVAEMCITCKEDSEMSEKSKLYKRVSKSLGKTAQEYGRARQ